MLASQFGMNNMRRLKPGAVPTIFHPQSTSQVCTSAGEERSLWKRTAGACPTNGDEVSSKRKREAVEKRQRCEV